MSEETAPRMRSMRMNYRADDKTIIDFIEAQEAKSVSLRLLITLFMREHGAQDVTTVVSQVLGGHDGAVNHGSDDRGSTGGHGSISDHSASNYSASDHDRVTTADTPEDTAAEADKADKDTAANKSVQDTPETHDSSTDEVDNSDGSADKSKSEPESESEPSRSKPDAGKKKPDISEMINK